MKSSLRVAFDLDGVLANFSGAYERIADELFPGWRSKTAAPASAVSAEGPPSRELGKEAVGRLSRRRRRDVWNRLRSTHDFWLTLDPIDPEAIPRLQERALHLGWETFFITQRPATVGSTVQLQTQRWLAEHGFALPTVIVHMGSRGRLAAALELDILVDDTVQHCVDALSASSATPILVNAEPDPVTSANARQLGFEICAGPCESLDLIERAAASGTLRSLVRVGRDRLGW